jgi:Integrase core domain
MSRSDIIHELFKQPRVNYPTRHVVVKGIDDLVEMDLMDMQKLSKWNGGYKYILCAINVFSKKGYCTPVKDKTAATVSRAADEILKNADARFKLFHSDRGSEFNGVFLDMLKRHGIKKYFTYSNKKAAVVERFIKTIKYNLYRDMSLRAKQTYIEALKKIVDKYNNTKHRTIGMPPNKVNKRNEKFLLETVYNYDRKIVKPKYKVGQFVRRAHPKSTFSRIFYPSYSVRIYKIVARNKKFPVTYKLMDGAETVDGSFYEPQLQLVKNPDIFLVEKVIRRRGNRAFVKWEDYPSEFNSWVDINEIYNPEDD